MAKKQLFGMCRNKKKCKRIVVDPNVCYISFRSAGFKRSHDYHVSTDTKEDFKKKAKKEGNPFLCTIRNEDIILDWDNEGKMIGIELLGCKKCRKPCQE